MAGYRILHISDLHFGEKAEQFSIFTQRVLMDWQIMLSGASGGAGMQSMHCSLLAQESARFIFQNCVISDNIDALVISGDLCSTGFLKDLIAGHQFIVADPDPLVRHLTSNSHGTLGAGPFSSQ